METAIRKATRLDYNPPKQKHLETLIGLTFQSPGNTASIIDILEKRLRENSWIITFKVLIIIHTLIRHGQGDKALSYIATRPSALDTSRIREKSSGVGHIQNIYVYTAYLENKVSAFRHLKMDPIKNTLNGKVGRLRHLSVQKGLLKETIVLQKQMGTLLKCKFLLDDVDNNISLYAFRLLVEDLLVFFQMINEAIVNILEHYFAMNKTDARASLDIYKLFAKQTEDTIAYLDRARQYQHDLNISIPKVKHAPLSLATALQEYLDDAEKSNSTSDTVSKENQPTTTTPITAAIAGNNNNNVSQQQQPKELADFLTSVQNDTTTTHLFQPAALPIQQQQQQQQQPYQMTHFNSFGSNPSLQPFSSGPQTLFSSTVPNAPLQQLPPAMGPQQALPLPPTSSLSTGSNPFRSNTIGPSATTSTSTPLHYNNATLNPSSSNPFRSSTMPITSLMQQQPSSSLLPLPPTSPHNPFATNNNQQISFLNRATTISVASSIPPSTNPFSQQQLSSWK